MNTQEVAQPGLFQSERQNEIYLMTLRNGAVDVSELAKHFDVTPETIRRDLSDLQQRRLLRRVHGGAVAIERRQHEPMLDNRNTRLSSEKLRIAQFAIRHLPASGTVLLDSGSTVQRIADIFPTDSATHVLTNSLTTALALVRRGVADVTVLGGNVRAEAFAMVDSGVVDFIRSIRIDTLFISCDGLSFDRGLTSSSRDDAAVKRAMVDASKNIVAVVDHSKFDNDHTYGFLPLSRIDVLITDERASTEGVDHIASHGVAVTRA